MNGVQFRQYVKNKYGHRLGVFVVDVNENNVSIGYSLCSKYDRFDVNRAISIAEGRANVRPELNFYPASFLVDEDAGIDRVRDEYIPNSIRNDFDRVVDRVRRIVASFRRHRVNSVGQLV